MLPSILPLRFRRKITREPNEYMPGNCWVWGGEINYKGYGRVWLHSIRYSIHRLMFVFYVRDLQPHEQVDHKCFNRACCNPKHLEATTQQENLSRRRYDGTWKHSQQNYDLFQERNKECVS